MHHLYPASKGDQLCPLGFHPQVRWPTRCKRCFRDYKDHGTKRSDEIAASSPSLTEAHRSRAQSEKPSGRNWTSTTNLSNAEATPVKPKRPASWTSTPDLDDDNDKKDGEVEINLALPRRRHTTTLEMAQVEESFTLRRPPLPPHSKESPEDLIIQRSDSLAERVRKMQLLKKQNSLDRELRIRNSSAEKEKSPSPAAKSRSVSVGRDALVKTTRTRENQSTNAEDVKKLNDELVQARNNSSDRNDILLRRLAFPENGDVTKLQFKINELSRQLEDTKYEKLHLSTKVKELEKSLSIKASKSSEEELRKKLQAAEQLCEELMDENNEIKKEMQNMEAEIDEMQDNFRDDQANEYVNIKKELESTTKNCRILSFKLKKSERKIEQLEAEKQQSSPAALINQIKKLEDELRASTERTQQLQSEAEKAQLGQSRAPTLSTIGKSSSVDRKFSRAALTRGGSQEDPAQLMRDLQDSIEREADVREQLKFAEEEAESLRKKVLRIEDENESLMMQLKKMATKARSRKHSPNRLTVDSSLDKDEGISDEEDPAELRVLLDLNEQEASQLRQKVDELEQENKAIKNQVKELRDVPKTPTFGVRRETLAKDKEIAELQKKIGDAEKEIAKLRKNLATKKGDDDKKKDLETSKSEIKNLKLVIAKQEIKVTELEKTNAELDAKCKKAATELKSIEEKLAKQESLLKQAEATRSLVETQSKQDKERLAKIEKELDAERKEKRRWESKVSDLDADLTSLRKKFQNEKVTLEKEIATLKSQKDTVPNYKLDELKKQNLDLIAQSDLDARKLNEVTSKYEQLEEEHIFIKAKLTSDKESLQSTNETMKGKLSTVESELDRFKRDNIDLTRKIVDMQAKYKELEGKQSQNSVLEHERKRLLASLQEKSQQYERLASENEMNKDLSLQWKKENDELRRKLSDFEKVNKVQASLNDHSSSLEHEIKQLRAKLESATMVAKSDLAATRLRYEQQVYNMQTELNAQQKQCERFKRDRDSFKQLLEGAKKTIKELKTNSGGRTSKGSTHSGDEDDRSRVLILEQKMSAIEDELCEARLEASKLKTELVSEKTVSEIKLSEMQSRINEYEEERLLGSGRTKMPGIKTKLELSWQKEREEQQRLLQETSTLARDLRQTLFEVERERDKERLENRRRIEQLERNSEEDLEEGRRKVAELQCDLLELRDAHAKLRTSNEKLRLERERYERERENFYRRGIELNLDRRLNTLLQTVDELIKVSPESVQNSILKKPPTPNAQKRLLKTNSIDRRESASPARDFDQISQVLSRLVTVSDDIRQFQKNFGEDRERERLRRSQMRRAMSSENGASDNERPPTGQRLTKSSSQSSNLYRKSISFDQSISGQQKIWKNKNDSASSIDSEMGSSHVITYARDSSLDSRLSGGSTQSDLPRRRKKRGLMGKLKNLARGSSKTSDNDGSQLDSGSDISLGNYDHKTSKGNLKERISDMFKRSSSVSRQDSEEMLDASARSASAYSNRNTPVLSPRHPSPSAQSSSSKVRMTEASNSSKTPTSVKRVNKN